MKKVFFICMALLSAGTLSAFAMDEECITQIPIGTSREEVHLLIGKPQRTSSGEYKEIYLLDNGNAAVLTYSDDNLNDGFIVINYK